MTLEMTTLQWIGLVVAAIVVAAIVVLPPLVFVVRSVDTIRVFARAHWFRSRLTSPLQDSTLKLRASVMDCDVNMHITNACYLSLVDAGRFELLARLGFFPLLLRRGYRSLIGTTCIRFRREVPMFRRYVLRSRLIGWDDKWIYTEHHFELEGRAVVVVLSKFLVIDGKRDKLAPSEALRRMMGDDNVVDSPPLPERVTRLLRDSDVLMSPD